MGGLDLPKGIMRIEPGRAWTEDEVQEITRLWIESETGSRSVVYRSHRVWFESPPKFTVILEGAYVVDVSFAEKGPPRPETSIN
jgi:hypothetical protein